jgi:multiple sugar transport system ATP-binding protein
MAQVVLEKLSKTYPGGVTAVDGIDLVIADHEIVVLVGPSGCGKSTTLRMIAGLEEISSGTIRIGGKVVNDVPPKDRDIAMVFQNYALYPHMTVSQNMGFGLKLRKMPKAQIRERVLQAAKMLEIEHLLDRKPKALSGGQRQRVAVGRAIVREPAAFLFDEPLSNLDAKLRVTTRAELKRLHQRLKTTTIYVTHDQEEAMTLGDRIVVMKDGVIQQADAPLVTYRHPRNRFVAGFIGMPPMNFFDGAVRVREGRLVFEEGKLPHREPGKNGLENDPGNGSGAFSELTLPGNGFTLSVPLHLREMLSSRVGQHLVLGIRPEHLHLRAMAEDALCCALQLKLNVIEPLGNDMDVYMQTNLNDHVVARVKAATGDAASPGLDGLSQVTMYADLSKIHFFEPGQAGANLSLSQGYSNELSHALA